MKTVNPQSPPLIKALQEAEANTTYYPDVAVSTASKS
jgi:hypothetical protein